jgi:hypothetical protein
MLKRSIATNEQHHSYLKHIFDNILITSLVEICKLIIIMIKQAIVSEKLTYASHK